MREAEGKLKALRALQPDSVRLEQLRSGVMAATTERLRQLEGQAGAKAVMASELHDEQEALQREAQVIVVAPCSDSTRLSVERLLFTSDGVAHVTLSLRGQGSDAKRRMERWEACFGSSRESSRVLDPFGGGGELACLLPLQEFQQLLREAVWPMDRLAGEIADLKNEIAVLENRMRASGSIRAVGAVDSELEALEGERAKNERQKDELLRRQGRLRQLPPWSCWLRSPRVRKSADGNSQTSHED